MRLETFNRIASVASGLAIGLVAAESATAVESGAGIVTCISHDGSRRHCPGHTDAGVAIRRSIGSAACLLGRNWGYDAEGVWVTEGCGAEFVLGNPAHEQERLADRAGATPAPPADAAESAAHGVERSLGDYEVYTRLGTQVAFVGDEAQVQDASSRVGFKYSIGSEMKLFAAAEWSVDLTGTENPFNPGETTSSGFVQLETVSSELFGNRLGYVGADLGTWGRVTLGKQWGVHYDVAGYTDRFHVFGADASATFNAGTDGGFMGTGRADGALVYRQSWNDRIEFGAQLQARGFANDEAVDGYAASLRLAITDEIEAGASYTRAHYGHRIRGQVVGLDGDGEYTLLGLRYDTERLQLAGLYAWQRNGDLARVPELDNGVSILLPVAFDAEGIELFGRVDLGHGVGLLGGYLDYEPEPGRINGAFLDPRAGLEYYVVGADYRWLPGTLMFAEYRFADGYDALGVRGEDAFVLGFQYWFRLDGEFDPR